MARKPGAGRCVHCLGYFDDRTWDHVFPESWYPDTTPNNLAKWQIPTCRKCNEEYGEIENDLRTRLALCIDPNTYASSGIFQKVLRSLDPAQSKNQKDRRLRKAKRDGITREAQPVDRFPSENVLRVYKEDSGQSPEEQIAIPISEDSLHKLAKKIVRGIFYLEEGMFIEGPYTIDVVMLRDSDASPFIQLLDKFGNIYAREPGITVTRAVTPEDGISSIFRIVIWNQITIYASVRSTDV